VWVALQEAMDEYGAHLSAKSKEEKRESRMLRIFWLVDEFSPVDLVDTRCLVFKRSISTPSPFCFFLVLRSTFLFINGKSIRLSIFIKEELDQPLLRLQINHLRGDFIYFS